MLLHLSRLHICPAIKILPRTCRVSSFKLSFFSRLLLLTCASFKSFGILHITDLPVITLPPPFKLTLSSRLNNGYYCCICSASSQELSATNMPSHSMRTWSISWLFWIIVLLYITSIGCNSRNSSVVIKGSGIEFAYASGSPLHFL